MSKRTIITEAEFLEAANGKCRCRTFGDNDYMAFRRAVMAARRAAKQGRAYYRSDDMGGVANCYGSTTTTAIWAVHVVPKSLIVRADVRRVMISGRSVPCGYYGGERAYLSDWQDARSADTGEEAPKIVREA